MSSDVRGVQRRGAGAPAASVDLSVGRRYDIVLWMRAALIAIGFVLCTALAAPATRGQQANEPPVWKAVELGRHIAEEIPEPFWETAQAPAEGIDPDVLRLQRQVIEAHAVGQGLRKPFPAKIARQAFKGYLDDRFGEEEHAAVRGGLQKWGIAYSSAIELAAGNDEELMGYIRQVFANAVGTDKASAEAAEASAAWRGIVALVERICDETMRRAIIVPEDED